MQNDGETALDDVAMELDTLLYSEYGEYVLDEVTVMLESISDVIDDTRVHEVDSLDTLTCTHVHKMGSKLTMQEHAALTDALCTPIHTIGKSISYGSE